MHALLFAAMLAAADPDLGARLAQFVGAPAADAPGCYDVNARYVACVVKDDVGNLRRIRVQPRAWLHDGEEFDFDRSLSMAEYLDVVSRLQHAVSFGAPWRDSSAEVSVIMNLAYDVREWWTAAVVVRSVNLRDEGTVREFTVFFFSPVHGRIVRYDERCNRKGPPTNAEQLIFEIEPRCEPEIGPSVVSIDNRDYTLAPAERRCYLPGETVEVLAVDLDTTHDLDAR